MQSRMRVLLTSLLGSALLCSACGGGGSGDGFETPPETSEEFNAVGTALDGFINDGSVTGYAFALFDDAGVMYSRDGGNMSIRQPVLIASASKLPSAAAILTLVDSGRLNLDVPVAQYLGNNINWPANKQAITMRMLLSHTSSLEPNPSCLVDTSTTTLQECVQEIANLPLIGGAPGTSFSYGGGSYQVAGYIATLLSGQSWQAFFNSRIGAPLRLTSFTYGDTNNPRIAGGAVANVGDEAKIMRMVLARGMIDGRRVLSEAMVTEVLRDQIAGKRIASSPLGETFFPGYTLGYFVSNPAIHRGSRGPEFSDPGLFGAVPWIDVGSNYGGVILINSSPAVGISMWNTVRPLILAKLGIP